MGRFVRVGEPIGQWRSGAWGEWGCGAVRLALALTLTLALALARVRVRVGAGAGARLTVNGERVAEKGQARAHPCKPSPFVCEV